MLNNYMKLTCLYCGDDVPVNSTTFAACNKPECLDKEEIELENAFLECDEQNEMSVE